MATDTEIGVIPVRTLLASKSLAPALRARIAAAAADGGGSLTPDEVLAVLRSGPRIPPSQHLPSSCLPCNPPYWQPASRSRRARAAQ
jgi:hypothetical protein